jgi:hypothetical protein
MKTFLVLCLCIAHLAYGATITWNPPVNLTDPAAEASNSQVGLDSHGNAVAVWSDSNAGLLLDKGSTKLYGQAWTPATGQNIDNTTGPVDLTAPPALSVDSQGNALAIFDSDNGGDSLRYSYKPFGMAWSPGQISMIEPSQYQVVLNPPGNGTAVWIQGTSLFASTFNGSTWTTPVQIDTTAYSPSLAVDPNGNATVVWIDTATTQIKSATLPFGESWGPLMVVETYIGGFLGFTSLAVDPNGNAVAFWSSDSGMQSATKLFNQGWSSVTTFPNTGTSNSHFPVVAVDPQGNAMALWENDTTSMIQSASKPFGQPWSSVVTLGGGINPQIALDSCGTAVGVWAANSNFIQTAFKPLGMNWVLSQSFPAANFGGMPQISINPCGHIMVTWSGPNGNPSNIFAVEGFINTPNFAPLTGKQKKDNSGTYKQFINRLKWEPSTTPVEGYNVYRNGSFLIFVKHHSYTDGDQVKGQAVMYEVTSVDLNGIESLPLIVIVQ